jgi:tetratricopeptide (TPR) repeat protein
MDGILQLWNSLPQEVRYGIIIAVGGSAAVGIGKAIVTYSGKSISAGAKRLFTKAPSSVQSPQLPPQQLLIKVETAQPLPSIKEPDPPQPPPLATHLPRRPAVGFVARRDKEGRDIVARLKETLTPESSHLIVLWGEGGIGKTTLAAEAARELFAVFAKRILWTSADGREDFSLSTLLDEIATQLGNADLRRLALEPKKEEVRTLIAAAPTLITLDNFETISPVEQTNCAKWIAEHAPCPALITTRQQINGAHNILIDAMSLEEAREFLTRLIEQAGNSRTFEGLDQDRIIQSADANPLVMQWIIAQIGLAQRPSDVLDDLAHGEGDAAKRVFDRSFKLAQLSDDGRDTLLALSLFAPSASRPALAEVAGLDSDVKRLNEAIKSLAALCLVETTDAGERLTIKGLTRELARAHLRKDKRADEFRRRFVAYFVRYAEAHAKKTAEDFDTLEKEKDNLLNSMDAAFEIEDWESVIRMMDVIGRPVSGFLSLRGYWDEFIRRGEQVLMAARTLQDGAAIDRFTHNIAVMYQNRGDLNEARRLYDESFDIKKRLGNQSGIAITLHQLGRLAEIEGDSAEARRLYNESLDITKKLGDQSGIASTLHQLAMIAQDEGDTAEARRLYNESLDIAKKLGSQSSIASSLHELGRLAQAQGEIAEARRLYNESLEIKKRLGDQRGIASSLHQLGRLAENQGDKAEAARLFREALSIFEKLGSPDAEIARQSLKRVEGKSD